MVRKILIILGWTFAILLTVTGVYLGFLSYPQPAFSYQYASGPLHIYSDQPIEENIEKITEQVKTKIGRVIRMEESEKYKVFFCHKPWRQKLIFALQPQAAGLNNSLFSGNTFIRTPDIEQNIIIGPNGKPVTGGRTLSNTIAHEITHKILFDKVGRSLYLHTEPWIIEGYCDRIGMNPIQIGQRDRLCFLYQEKRIRKMTDWYDLYHLLVDYYLDQKGYSIEELMELNLPLEVAAGECIRF